LRLQHRAGHLFEKNVFSLAQGLNAFVRIVEQLLQDIQERLVYRSNIYIQTDIQNYNPSPGDLAYPEKLEMMEVSQIVLLTSFCICQDPVSVFFSPATGVYIAYFKKCALKLYFV